LTCYGTRLASVPSPHFFDDAFPAEELTEDEVVGIVKGAGRDESLWKKEKSQPAGGRVGELSSIIRTRDDRKVAPGAELSN
jgi:hypothetical protein